MNKTRCHQKWRDGKARPRHSGPILTPHREESTREKVPHFDLSTVAPRNPRIKNSNEDQVLYGILLSNEQLFVRQWPKGQIKKCKAHYYDPARKHPTKRVLGKRCRTCPSDRSSEGPSDNNGVWRTSTRRGIKANRSYLAGIMATDKSRWRIPSKAIWVQYEQ